MTPQELGDPSEPAAWRVCRPDLTAYSSFFTAAASLYFDTRLALQSRLEQQGHLRIWSTLKSRDWEEEKRARISCVSTR